MSRRGRVLFFDRSTGCAIPRALKCLGLPTKYGDDLFAKDAKDDVWLHDIGRRGWVLCTQDYSHHQNMNEALAIKQHKIRCFYLWGAQAPKWEMMKAFIRGYDRMKQIVDTEAPPYIYRFDRLGRIRKVPLP